MRIKRRAGRRHKRFIHCPDNAIVDIIKQYYKIRGFITMSRWHIK